MSAWRFSSLRCEALGDHWGATTRTYHHTAPTNSLFALHEALLHRFELRDRLGRAVSDGAGRDRSSRNHNRRVSEDQRG